MFWSMGMKKMKDKTKIERVKYRDCIECRLHNHKECPVKQNVSTLRRNPRFKSSGYKYWCIDDISNFSLKYYMFVEVK